MPLGRLYRDAVAGKGRAFWEAEETKIIKVYRAPIEDADGKAIAAYLADAS